MRRWKFALATGVFALVLAHAVRADFDHTHGAWSALLAKHVVAINNGTATQVRYAAFAQDRAALKIYLASLSAVTEAEFKTWDKPRQMAFLINAYNAFTVEKILTRYPNLKSIRDFGGVLGDPWKDKFFKLLGHDSYLNQIEHEWLRRPGLYDEPRVHFAVNCASVGCPALRAEAYVAEKLDAQLEDQTRRFLSDRSRNHYNAQKGALEVSKIFDWYKEDWTSSYRGIATGAPALNSREQFFARYALLLTDQPGHQTLIAGGKVPIATLDYDWTLNDSGQ
jgi:hypothetical protein